MGDCICLMGINNRVGDPDCPVHGLNIPPAPAEDGPRRMVTREMIESTRSLQAGPSIRALCDLAEACIEAKPALEELYEGAVALRDVMRDGGVPDEPMATNVSVLRALLSHLAPEEPTDG